MPHQTQESDTQAIDRKVVRIASICASIGACLGILFSLYDTIIRGNWMFGNVLPALVSAIVFGLPFGGVGYLVTRIYYWGKR